VVITLGLIPCLVSGGFAANTNKADNQKQVRQGSQGQENLMYGSNLIGQPVKNSQGQHIGKVDELMIDPKDGKIKYGVLNVGEGFLGIGNKLVAIPWESFHLSTTEAGYLLDIDKDTLAKTPAIDQRSWQSRRTVKVTEEPGTTYRPTAGTGRAEDVKGNEKQYSGTIEAIDAAAGTVTIKKMMISHNFRTSGALTQANLSQFKVGDEVEVGYTETPGGTNVVHRIMPVEKK
jgi:sporulation protein YlmC with PRC-barrel domain/Cu/Ag efflux protein CusF